MKFLDTNFIDYIHNSSLCNLHPELSSSLNSIASPKINFLSSSLKAKIFIPNSLKLRASKPLTAGAAAPKKAICFKTKFKHSLFYKWKRNLLYLLENRKRKRC